MSFYCECCVFSRRDLCVGLMTRSESPSDCGASECDREVSIMKRPWPTRGAVAPWKKKIDIFYLVLCICWLFINI
jgi:hypothetical protein